VTVTTLHATGRRGHGLVVLDVATGEHEWRVTPAADHFLQFPVIGRTIVTATDRDCSSEDGGGELVAFDLSEGAERWRAPHIFGINALRTFASVDAAGLVVGAADDDIVAVDAASGVERWRHADARLLATTKTLALALDSGPSPTREVLALDRRSGDVRWALSTSGDGAHDIDIVAANEAYVIVAERAFQRDDGPTLLQVVDAGSGASVTTFEASISINGNFTFIPILGLGSQLAISGDSLILLDEVGTLVSHDLATGAVRWSVAITLPRLAVAPDQRVVYATTDFYAVNTTVVGDVRAVDTTDGVQLWTLPGTGFVASTDGTTVLYRLESQASASPRIELEGVSTKTGERRWSKELRARDQNDIQQLSASAGSGRVAVASSCYVG
jgi:outer membrane protein assembly factor BamB